MKIAGWVGKLMVMVLVLGSSFVAQSTEAQIIKKDLLDDKSPVNQVFQWQVKEDSNQTAYLWIPENCNKVRGLLILGWNVPEHKIVGHSAIRKACADNGLGIVVSNDFWGLHSPSTKLACFQRQLDLLAGVSGYPEIASVPLLPIGESGHLKMVCLLMDSLPDRCIAAACMKDATGPKTIAGKTVPLLNTKGTGYEWTQTNSSTDPRTYWNTDLLTYYQNAARATTATSVLIEAGTGHFDCTERMTQYLARYIEAAVRARLPEEGGNKLLPVDKSKGYVADVAIPGITDLSIIPYSKATDAQKASMSWYFDAESAKEAQAISHANWDAETQIPSVYAGENDSVNPFSFNGATSVKVFTNSTFSLKPYLLDSIPLAFTKPGIAGAKLAKSPNKPYIEWICGNIQPLGNNKFKVIGSRYTGAGVLMIKVDSSKGIRYSNQPLLVNLVKNNKGETQTITFPTMPNQKSTATSIPLKATSDKGLPVGFYVESGPAMVDVDKLVLTKIPPKAKYPVAVSVVAWQWGTCTSPLIKQAMVKQTFFITQ